LADAFKASLICHCSQFRRATGAAAKPFAGTAANAMVVRGPSYLMGQGDGQLFDRTAAAAVRFCIPWRRARI
jgi:hypothetical protein